MKLFDSHTKLSRSASMQLSINAIVILVLAMAILGLGLGIIRGISQKKDDLLGFDVKLEQTADATDHIANVKSTWEMRQGKGREVGASFYNVGSSGCTDPGAEINVSCEDAGEGTFDILQVPQGVEGGEAGIVKAIVTANGFASKKYACSFQIVCSNAAVESETIFIDMVG